MKQNVFFFLIFLVSINGHASNLILEEIQKSIITDYKLEGKIKIIEETPSDSIIKIPIAEPPKKLSRGEQSVQEQLRQNREKIKQLHEQDQNTDQTQTNDWAQAKQQEINDWKINKVKEIKAWQNEKQLIINQWLSDQGKFVERIPQYKENLISENDFRENLIQSNQTAKTTTDLQNNKTDDLKKVNSKKITMPIFPDYFVIDKALDVEIKDQGQRPTCAAFTGIRAMEILMSQQGKMDKLSEQYFFWSSIPKCQTSPCKKEGSWVFNGYQSSLNASSPNIPLNKDCPYVKSASNDNVTQIPLSNGCLVGHAKIKKFNTVLTTAEIINAIKNGHPVIGGFKLSENFYHNKGYVFEQSANDDTSKLDEHAGGHAILLVGIMKLPPELHKQEGKFCLISANSWGPGWVKGGHACLSDKWIDKHRFDVPFVALEEIATI